MDVAKEKIKRKEIKGFEGFYWVYTDGKILSLYTNKFLKPIKKRRGYVSVHLYKNGKMFNRRVQRVVAETFIPNPNNFPVVNHKNGDINNNSIENLEWCTQKYNVHHAIHVLNRWSNSKKQRRSARSVGIKNRKLSLRQAQEMRDRYKKGASVASLARDYDLSWNSTDRIVKLLSYKTNQRKP